MRNISVLFLGFLILTFQDSVNGSVDENPFLSWKKDISGIYDVGFKSKIIQDQSRPPLIDSVQRGQQTSARSLQMSIWYPTTSIEGIAPVYFKKYIESGILHKPEETANNLYLKAIEIWTQESSYMGAEPQKIKSLLKKIETYPGQAYQNPLPAKGKFPAIIFPAHTAHISIMAEYLASHGFVVIASSLQGTWEIQFDVSTKGLQTAARDILLLASEAKKLTFADGDNVGVMGLGIVASAALLATMQHPSIKAFVSLEGGITTKFEDDLLKKSPYFDIVDMTSAMLIIHAPHQSVNPELVRQYKYAEQQYLYFEEMKEFYFYNFGLFEKYEEGILGEAPGDTYNGFKQANFFVANFFNAKLKKDTDAASLLKETYINNDPSRNNYEGKYQPALLAPPNLEKSKLLIKQKGWMAFTKLYQQLKEQDSAPFSFDTLTSLYQWFSSQKEPQIKKEYVTRRMIEDYPQHVLSHFLFARILESKGEKDSSLVHFEQAISLLDEDLDFKNNPDKSAQYRTYISNKIASLKSSS